MSAVLNTGQYPPVANLATTLGSSNLSVLATKAFADANSGYGKGLHLAAALDDNSTGHFSLVSGLTIGGSAVSASLAALDNIQTTLTKIQQNVGVLSDSLSSQTNRDDNRVQLENNLDILSQYIGSADVGGFNLLDASLSDGISLDLNTGQFANTGTTPVTDMAGVDRRYSYDPNSISFLKTDLRAAFNDLDNLRLQTFPDTEADLTTTDNLATVNRFQSVIDSAGTRLKALGNTLAATAMERLSVNFDPTSPVPADGSAARQMAARLALRLSNESFNITANPAIRFFSLFG